MRPVTHTLIDHVRAPIDRVFTLLTDPGRMPEWLPGCSGVETEAPLKKGARFKPRFGTRLTEFEVVDFAPPNTFGWVERGQRRGSKTFFRLDFCAYPLRSVSRLTRDTGALPTVSFIDEGVPVARPAVREEGLTGAGDSS